MCHRDESDIHVVVTRFPSGVRDFCLVRPSDDGVLVPLEPLEMLGTDSVAHMIRRVAERGQYEESLAMNFALSRLLVPQLRYRGSGRHLVVEEWSEHDLRGETLCRREENLLARDLSRDQADDWKMATSGERPPEGSLAELAWRSFTLLPELGDRFDNPDLGVFMRALYLYLIPSGEGFEEVDPNEINSRISRCRESGFENLNLLHPRRRLNQLFRTALAVTLRWSGQLTGAAVEQLIQERTQTYDDPKLVRPLDARERDLLALRYGASRALSDINVGYLFGSGNLMADAINDYAIAHVQGDNDDGRNVAGENLNDFLFLLAHFLERRRALRAYQRRELRQRRADRLPGAERRQAQNECDNSAQTPAQEAQTHEEIELFHQLLPELRERDVRRLEAYIDAGGDRRAAAESLGLSHHAYSQQLRQTVFPNVRKTAKRLGLFRTNED